MTYDVTPTGSIQNEELESDFLNKTFIASSPKKGNTEQILFSESNSITRENGYSPDYGYDIMNTDNSCEDTLIYSNSSSETLINHSIHDNTTYIYDNSDDSNQVRDSGNNSFVSTDISIDSNESTFIWVLLR